MSLYTQLNHFDAVWFMAYQQLYLMPDSFIHLSSRLGLMNTPTVSLQWGKTPPNECPVYDTNQSDSEVPAVLELWRMRSKRSLSSLPGPLWPGVVAPDRALSMG